MVWSPRAEQVVAGLIAGRTAAERDPARNHSARPGALHLGACLWADDHLRPNGEVVVVGEDHDRPDVDTVHTDRNSVLRALVWGSQRYPEMRELVPARPPEAADCRCRQIPAFAEGKGLCPACGALGRLPADAEPANPDGRR